MIDDEVIDIKWEFPFHNVSTEREGIDSSIFPFMLMLNNAVTIGDYLIRTYPYVHMIFTSPEISIDKFQRVALRIYTEEDTEELLCTLSEIKSVFDKLFMREDYWNNLIDFDRYFNIRSALNWSRS